MNSQEAAPFFSRQFRQEMIVRSSGWKHNKEGICMTSCNTCMEPVQLDFTTDSVVIAEFVFISVLCIKKVVLEE